MKIPLLNLPAQYKELSREIDAAVKEVMLSGGYIMGPQVKQFEDNMARFLGVKHAVAVASGSDALLLSLHALGIGPGDKVIVPAFTFFATAGAVSRLGAVPLFADIDPVTLNINTDHIEELLQSHKGIKAVIPVHIFGLPCEMTRIMELAEQYQVKVVEDACQAIDADLFYNGMMKKAGAIGATGCFSFFPSKNLGGYGDGGMAVTNDDELADKIRILRVHGSHPKYYHQVVGYNSRLDTIQAAILNVKLKYLPEWTKKRRAVALIYNREFSNYKLNDIVTLPQITEGHAFHQYTIQVDKRDELAEYLKERGIGTAIYYPLPLHLQECFSNLSYPKGDLPIVETVCNRVLSLPIDPNLSPEEINYIVTAISDFYLSERV
ncbi:MAG: DegT/DnrJ/EryC1/StrS family aminotransferase [Syntrophomonadaceae bacterium]|nr:DegT/DnrJ/EryC1/StrS family aminotransferase [Syntrophomonadaceae bacterium]